MKRIFGLVLIVIIAKFSYAQIPYFQYYLLLKKNETVHVNAIFQDHTGLMWYGTNKGLFSFDGLIQTRLTTKDSLPDENVTAIAEDSLGRIWTGYKNGQLAFIEDGRVRKFNPSEGTPTQPISDILFDNKGNLWFSTFNDGLYYFVNDRLFRLDEEDGMPDIFIYDILEDSQGNILAGTDGGLAVCNLMNKKVSIKVINYDLGLPDNIIKKIMVDDNGTLWMATEDAGVINYDMKTGSYKSLMKSKWNYGSIDDFLIKDNTFWISSEQSGLVVYDRKSDQVKLYNSKTGINLSAIKVLSKDREGNIWAGTKTGLMRTHGDNLEYINDLDPVMDLNIVSLAIDKQHNLWFSTAEGLFKRTIDLGGNIVVKQQLLGTPYIKYKTVSLFVDSAGFIWAGLYGEGVLRINPINGKIQYLNKQLRNGNVLNITGRGNTIWLATLGGASQIRIEGEKLQIRNFSSADGLPSDYIYQVFIDSKNRVWFGTDGKGAGMMDEKGFHHYQDGLNSKVIYGFAEDHDHKIWVNVQGDGLYKLNDAKFHLPPAGLLLRDNNIACLSSDKFGNLVVMHELGIDICVVKNNTLQSMGDEVGIHNRQANLNAFAKDEEGNIYIGTDQGIIKYSAKGIDDKLQPLPIIDGMKVLNKFVDISYEHTFKYNQNNIVINYWAFWYQNPGNLSFEYKLEKYDQDWIRSRNPAVTYSSLPPGHYTFHLKVSATENFQDANEAVISFIINPPFWQTIMFYIICGLSIIFLGYGIIVFREQKLKADKKMLEKKVLERTMEIQKQTEEIQTQNEEITAQAEVIQGINENLELLVKQRTEELEKKNRALEEYAFINAHELRAPVASIIGLINLIYKSDLNDEAKLVAWHMKESAERLNDIVGLITKAIEKGD